MVKKPYKTGAPTGLRALSTIQIAGFFCSKNLTYIPFLFFFFQSFLTIIKRNNKIKYLYYFNKYLYLAINHIIFIKVKFEKNAKKNAKKSL
jgi:hypothetical protein